MNPSHPLDAASSSARVRWFFRSLIEKRIAQAESSPPRGIIDNFRLAWWRFLLGAVETLIGAVLAPGIAVVLWSYCTASTADGSVLSRIIASMLKIYGACSCIVLLFWTWHTAIRSRDRESLSKLLVDLGNLLSGSRMTERAHAYRYLLAQYREGRYSKFENPLNTIAATHKCELKPTSFIQEYYSERRKTAADWLCVISARKDTDFLQKKNFGRWLSYFIGFDHHKQPTDRIIRVFSTPVTFPEDSVGPAWDRSTYGLTEEERFMLLAYLFVNRAAGVETKLHCFDPVRDTDTPFFQEADYVLVFDPASESEQCCDLLFIAEPGDAQTCRQLNGKSVWTEAFRFEFYNRLTYGHRRTRKCDLIEDVTTANAAEVARTLHLSNLSRRWHEVSSSLKEYNPNFSRNDLRSLARRWNQWFPERPKKYSGF